MKGKALFPVLILVTAGLLLWACGGPAATATPTIARPTPTPPVAQPTPTPTTAVAQPTPTPTRTAAATPTPTTAPVGGDVAKGRTLFVNKGCGGCHKAPGVPEGVGTIGPALHSYATGSKIAGVLDYSDANMARWLKNPPAVKPGTLMPSLGLTSEEITHLIAFMQSLPR